MTTNLEYIPKTEIVIDSHGDVSDEDVSELARILLDNGYAVLLTREEDLTIINYIWAEDLDCKEANRNNIVFCTREDMYEYEKSLMAERRDKRD